MIRSMTGFASTLIRTDQFKGKLSIKTLNHRYFDWFFHGPDWGDLEIEMRRLAQNYINRGRVEVSLEIISMQDSGWEVRIEEGLAQKIGQISRKLAKTLGQNLSLSPDTFFRIPQLITIKRKELTARNRAFLKNLFQQTLEKVIAQREKEGRKLANALRKSLTRIEKSLKEVRRLAAQEEQNWRERLQSRIKTVLASDQINEKRFEEELAYLLIKSDLKEEITRLEAHINSLKEIISSGEPEPKGRQIDFLAQELLREASTLASKSFCLPIIKESLKMKTEIEAIRQQGQNIE
ncbi:MAG: YicC family protein [Candidatus Aminicenantes bacterium]|nr:YicC family protein [Candidatus Aminicenantes bacterium]